MVVLLCAVEVEILRNLESPGRDQFFLEAAKAYRARSNLLKSMGRTNATKVDTGRADGLEADAKKFASGQIRIVNEWTSVVTVTIDGVAYRVSAGEEKMLSWPAGAYPYEVEAARFKGTATVETGKTFTIKIRPS